MAAVCSDGLAISGSGKFGYGFQDLRRRLHEREI
jgi:hypothetical protein